MAREREILALARQCQGNVAVGEVALYASLSLDDARELLNQLAERGFCERRVEIGGAERYRFPDLAPY